LSAFLFPFGAPGDFPPCIRHRPYVANGGNGGQAYRTAYLKCKTNRAAEVNGSRLLRNAEVLARVAELQEKGAERASITLDGLIREAGEIQAQAIKNKQMAAAISALIAKAKLAGLWIDHSESRNTNVNYAISDEPLDEKAWANRHVSKH
jgi:hypothetical protein